MYGVELYEAVRLAVVDDGLSHHEAGRRPKLDGFTGGYTIIVKDYVLSRRQSTREAFVPLHHPPGHAQVDFGEAVVELQGRREKVAFFCLILPHSNVWFVKAYPGRRRRPSSTAMSAPSPSGFGTVRSLLSILAINGDVASMHENGGDKLVHGSGGISQPRAE